MITKEKPGLLIQRTPRIIPPIDSGVISIEAAPGKMEKPSISWFSILFPPIAMLGVTLGSAMIMKSRTILFSAIGMTVVSLIVSLANYRSTIRKHKKKENEKKSKYREYSTAVVQTLEKANVKQREITQVVHPTVDQCIECVVNLGKNLWERTSIEQDFLHVRLGVGGQLLKIQAEFPPISTAAEGENALLSDLKKRCDAVSNVTGIPFSLPMREVGLLGVVGNRARVRELINAMIIHLTTHHGYDDVKTVFIFAQEEQEHWEWVRWLPHVWNEDRSVRYMASDQMSLLKIIEDLHPLMKSRESRKNGYSEATSQTRLPHYIFFVIEPELLENTEFFNYLLTNDPSLGITSVFLSERIDLDLPLNCQTIIEAGELDGFIRRDLTKKSDDFEKKLELDYVNVQKSDQFARRLAPIRLKETGGKNKVPNMVTFLEIFEAEDVNDLNIIQRWNKNQANRSMSVPLGRSAGGKLFMFDMHEKFFGPHGLVAGTTGSGKSELLQSLILSLSVNYHPHEVAMVIVDYKGGGMANAFIGMPHLIGTITNLGGNQINRALVSISSELKRRQVLFSQLGVNSIDNYILRYREGDATIPLPHLIIIVDEFAELKSDQPDFMNELISAARVGRSLGIHLVLATQKPSGVVNDQIWSNSRFKLCLKVQDISDSQEMLKRPEAAEIKERGRGYLQVGNNEVFSLFQSAWSGAPYQMEQEETDMQVYQIGLNGARHETRWKQKESKQQKEQVTQLQAVVEQISRTAEKNHIQAVQPLWSEPLPERLLLEDCFNLPNPVGEKTLQRSEGLLLTLGMVDDPARQNQFSMQLDLTKDGHFLIYGAPGSGKTTLLKTMITSLATNYSADEVNFYILDFGSRTLSIFKDLPHFGDILFVEDEDKLNKLIKMLLQELEERKKLFSSLGIANILSYRNMTKASIPSIVVILDNYTAFSENYNDAVSQFITFVREGGNYGIHLIMTGTASNTFSYKLTQNVRQLIPLQLADKSDYYALVGRVEGLEPEHVAGRGLVKFDVPLEFQTALPCEGDTDEDVTIRLRALVQQIGEQWRGKRARKVPTIPTILSTDELFDRVEEERIKEKEQVEIFPVGLSIETTAPVYFKLVDFFSCIYSYTDTEQVKPMVESLVTIWNSSIAQDQLQIHMIDGGEQPLLPTMKRSDAVHTYVSTNDQLQTYMENIINELQLRKDSSRKAAALLSEDEVFDEFAYISNTFPRLFICITDVQQVSGMFNDEIELALERIARFGRGLGIYFFVCVNASDISRLKQAYAFMSVFIDRKCSILTGGTLQQHNVFSQEYSTIPYSEQSKEIGEQVGWLLRNNQKYKLKLPS
ncbi:type VII secretion protein EssC [Paenibacillus anaericanus]|uniref:Type VII secretion protein EssC n=1 Tax=Paenibacillus anaericanus TaxID=170367 RepID=A0A433XXE2_9BACL|nr:type VII secretion protein EssC [Paenibacillus anaericanus]RUT39517.1 type VII secretion protein EssC [Paenibacillus anaericanus]